MAVICDREGAPDDNFNLAIKTVGMGGKPHFWYARDSFLASQLVSKGCEVNLHRLECHMLSKKEPLRFRARFDLGWSGIPLVSDELVSRRKKKSAVPADWPPQKTEDELLEEMLLAGLKGVLQPSTLDAQEQVKIPPLRANRQKRNPDDSDDEWPGESDDGGSSQDGGVIIELPPSLDTLCGGVPAPGEDPFNPPDLPVPPAAPHSPDHSPAPPPPPGPGASSGAGVRAPRVAAPPPPMGPDASSGAGDRAPRASRKTDWGPFSYARVYRKGEFVAMGMTCKRHANAGDRPGTTCKVQMPLGVMDEDEAMRRLMQWALLGATIDCVLPDARSSHMLIRPRAVALLSRAELDAQLELLFPGS